MPSTETNLREAAHRVEIRSSTRGQNGQDPQTCEQIEISNKELRGLGTSLALIKRATDEAQNAETLSL